MTETEYQPTPVNIESGVASRTDQPFVALRIGEHTIQMSTAKARQIGQWLIEAAAASEADAFLVRFMTERVELERGQAVMLLKEFRAMRAEWEGDEQP